jgi:hypothetical protein
MEMHKVSRDDLLDVEELTVKLQESISAVLADQVLYLSMPALIGATIRCILSQCETVEQAVFYKDVFLHLFEAVIKQRNVTN